ncbi:hypothetical protein N9860_03585, partial [Akkermansiaceae bacterium]|nr:hypothetical protein [Akkermansiaceae bacterium]MDB4275744.1 hypothetical protein [Akkermansiaceae bacterium]
WVLALVLLVDSKVATNSVKGQKGTDQSADENIDLLAEVAVDKANGKTGDSKNHSDTCPNYCSCPVAQTCKDKTEDEGQQQPHTNLYLRGYTFMIDSLLAWFAFQAGTIIGIRCALEEFNFAIRASGFGIRHF